MAPQPNVTGLSPKEGPPGTKVTIRGEFLGTRASDLIGLTICGFDCLLSAEWKSANKIIARTGPAKGKGDVVVTTLSGGTGTSMLQFRAYHELIGPMKESAVWIEESPMQSLAWGRRSMAPSGYTQEDPLGLSVEGNEKTLTEDLRETFPDMSGDLSQENFSPGWFLLENHNSTLFEDLKAGLSYLRRRVDSQRDGQLSFLKANAGSVMDQLDTLMMLRDRFEEDVKQVGTEPVKRLEKALNDSIIESNSLFTDVLHRRDKADATRAALLAISRHRFLFCLPNSVENNANKEEYDIVVNDYARAKNLFGKTEVSIFRKVLDEVDRRVLDIRRQLHTKILHMPQSVDRQKKFVKALIALEAQQIGSSVADELTHVDPAWDAIESRAHFLEHTLKVTFEQFTAKDAAQAQQQHSQPIKTRDPNQQPNRVQFCEEICEIAAEQMPDLWRLGQAYFSGELRGTNEPKPGNFKRIILTAIEQFCAYIRAAVLSGSGSKTSLFSAVAATTTITANISWPNNTAASIVQFVPWLPHCLRYLRLAYATLIGLDLPSEVLDIIQKVIDQIRLYCLTTVFKKTLEKVKHLEAAETWVMCVPEFPGATGLPGHLEKLVVDMLAEGQSTCLAPEMRETVILEPQSEGLREISKRFQDILDAFTSVIESLAIQPDEMHQMGVSQMLGFPNSPAALNSSVTAGGAGKGGPGVGLADSERVWETVNGWEQRLLCCMANCAFSNKMFFNHLGTLFERYGYPVPKMAIGMGRSTVMQLFGTLLETYVEQKSDPLVGTIEPSMYIGRFQWDAVPHTGKLRPYAHECLDNLVGVYSEIYTISPTLLRIVLEPIVQTVAEELARLMSCVQKFSEYGKFQANIDIQLMRDALKLFSNDTARSFFADALDVIPTLSAIGNEELFETLNHIRDCMKLQLMCFSVE